MYRSYRRIIKNVVGLLMLTILFGIVYTPKIIEPAYPMRTYDEIDIVFIFGVKAGNPNPVGRLDTRNKSFVKDMVLDPPYRCSMELNQTEMQQIVEKMNEVNFLNYPDLYTPRDSGSYMSHHMTYELRVYENGVHKKTVRMDTDIWSEDNNTANLRSLFGCIMSIIYNTEEYKASPKPTSGYC